MKNLILLFTLLSGAVWAETYPLPTGNNVEYELTVEQNIANAIATAKRKVNFTNHGLSASIIESIVRTRSGVAEIVEE